MITVTVMVASQREATSAGETGERRSCYRIADTVSLARISMLVV
jgi:hypothetical protein